MPGITSSTAGTISMPRHHGGNIGRLADLIPKSGFAPSGGVAYPRRRQVALSYTSARPRRRVLLAWAALALLAPGFAPKAGAAARLQLQGASVSPAEAARVEGFRTPRRTRNPR